MIALALTGGAVASTRHGRANCSKATARQVVNANHLNDFLLPQPVVQVACGAFTGHGSSAMMVTIAAGTCWGVQQWAVFRFADGAWHLVTDQHVWIVPPVVVVGAEIRVTSPVHRSTDSYCDPTGGTLARTWRWNGSRFVLVASRRTLAPVHPAELTATGTGFRFGSSFSPTPRVRLAR